MELDKHHIAPKRGLYGPLVPYYFVCILPQNPSQMGCIKIKINSHKNLIPLYTRETRHEKDFTKKKNIQQIEKTCSKKSTFTSIWWHKCHKQPSYEDLKRNSHKMTKRGHFFAKLAKNGQKQQIRHKS